MDDLKSRLTSALQNLELLTKQLKETQDYSKQAELAYLLKDLVEEQISNETGLKDENTHYSISAPR